MVKARLAANRRARSGSPESLTSPPGPDDPSWRPPVRRRNSANRKFDPDRRRSVEGVDHLARPSTSTQKVRAASPVNSMVDSGAVGQPGPSADDVTEPGGHLVQARGLPVGVRTGREPEGEPHVVLVHVAVEVTDPHEAPIGLVVPHRRPRRGVESRLVQGVQCRQSAGGHRAPNDSPSPVRRAGASTPPRPRSPRRRGSSCGPGGRCRRPARGCRTASSRCRSCGSGRPVPTNRAGRWPDPTGRRRALAARSVTAANSATSSPTIRSRSTMVATGTTVAAGGHDPGPRGRRTADSRTVPHSRPGDPTLFPHRVPPTLRHHRDAPVGDRALNPSAFGADRRPIQGNRVGERDPRDEAHTPGSTG